jgi:hypothetical protein
MAKSRKPISPPEPSLDPQVGDKVIPERSENTWVITSVTSSGKYVNLELPETSLDRFHVDVETLEFADRAERPTQKTLNLKADSNHLMERIDIIQRESLQHLDEDIELLTTYLKTEGAPAAVKAVESLRNEQTKVWQKVIERVKGSLE